MSNTLNLIDIAMNVGKNTIVLTKMNGQYKVFTETDDLIDLTREIVRLYKKTGMTSEQIIKMFNI